MEDQSLVVRELTVMLDNFCTPFFSSMKFDRVNSNRFYMICCSKGTSTLCRAAHSGKVRQGCVAKVVPCHKYMWMLCWLGCGMPFDAALPKNLIGKLSVPSKEAAWHMMGKGFQSGVSQFEKKIIPSSPISFHSFGDLKKVCKRFFFHVEAIALAAYTEQLLPRDKAAVCCILLRGIVWAHLKVWYRTVR